MILTPRFVRSFALMTFFALTGCERAMLSSEGAATLIQHYRTRHCHIVEFSARPSDFGVHDTSAMEAMLLAGLSVHRTLRTFVQSNSQTSKFETLTYKDGDDTQRVDFSESQVSNRPEDDRLVVQACLFLPSRIEVSDVAFESSTRASVLFSEHLRRSRLGGNLERSGLFSRALGLTPSEGHEFRQRLATLEWDRSSNVWKVTQLGPGT
jgi:hypothetical protein